MNKLALSAILIGGLLQTAGCIISTSDSNEAASFDVAWNSAECPGGSAAEVISQNQGSSERFTDIYDCAAGGGLTAALPLGAYDVWVEVTSSDGSQLLAQSNAVTASLTIDGQISAVDIPAFPINDGFFALTWSLVDTGGTALTCEEVGADGVDVIATLAGTSEATVDVFNCTEFSAVTDPVPVGTHTVVVDVLDGEAALGSSEPREETIAFGNELVDLGNFDFTF